MKIEQEIYNELDKQFSNFMFINYGNDLGLLYLDVMQENSLFTKEQINKIMDYYNNPNKDFWLTHEILNYLGE